jgi:hypothetical protein
MLAAVTLAGKSVLGATLGTGGGIRDPYIPGSTTWASRATA